ncbi:DUF6478 family protein [Phaeobacter sp. C3_T13_0]|uniref:DUF6478 family protein n=1 Tax=Phaeobacter cretensis TaxID=3342641 RepID=UPI0039BC22FF
MGRMIEKLLYTRVLRRWRNIAQEAHKIPLSRLRELRNRARALRLHLDRLIHTAEGRLALPQIGSSAFPRPHGTDWSWRPELWRGPLPVPGASAVPSKTKLGEEVQLFHDCTVSELTLRQLRNNREEDLAPYGVRLDVFRFDGSFLSLVIELPKDVTDGISREHLIRVDCTLEIENPIEIFARLNIKHGPNTEQLVREMPMGEKRTHVEYDLAYAELNEKRVERLWLELIFEAPEMNQVTLRDVTLSRSRRASL